MSGYLLPQQTVLADTHLRMPWANGLGETIELIRYPIGSSMGEMEFRISVASLKQAGPFSRFVSVERTLLLLDAAEIVLDVDGVSEQLSQFEQLTFDGESVTELISLTAPSRDLNVMCRKGEWTSKVTALSLDGAKSAGSDQADLKVWIFVSGNAVDSTGRHLESLDMSVSQEMPKWLGTGAVIRVCLQHA